jgi:uncharacterized protein (DUF849 family)
MSQRSKKLIISAALTGSATLPSQTPYLPITPDEIANAAYEAWQAGAAMVHVHARDPSNGKPSADPELYRKIVTKIKQKCDVVVGITTGGALGLNTEERIRVVPLFEPEVSSFNLGSMNFNLFPLGESISNFKYDWEREYLDITHRFPFLNTFADLEYFCKVMAEHGTKPECEIYDAGHLYNLAFLVKKGYLKQDPIWLQFVTGVLGGIGRGVDDVVYLVREADRLIGIGKYEWSVIGAGYPWEYDAAAIAIMMGGHVRVGIEDNIFIKRGELAKSNAELVKKVVDLAKLMDRDIASSEDARIMLNLKGKEKVAY